MKKMPLIFKLEVTFYLLVIGSLMLDKGNVGIAVMLFLIGCHNINFKIFATKSPYGLMAGFRRDLHLQRGRTHERPF